MHSPKKGNELPEITEVSYDSHSKRSPRVTLNPPPINTTRYSPPTMPKKENSSESYNRSFKSRFAHLYRHIASREPGKVSVNSDSFKTLEDVDFVFVVEKSSSQTLSFRLANWIGKIRGHQPITPENIAEARELYLKGLRETYKIDYSIIETEERYYYLIQLSFDHLGLMLELLGYHWQLETRLLPADRKVYKTFFFKKRGVDRYEDYHGCGSRSRASFDARWRYDLAYQFLAGATVKMPIYSSWRPALKEPLQEQFRKNTARESVGDAGENGEVEATTEEENGYSLLKLFSDHLFDDWMVLHDKMHQPSEEEVRAVYREVSVSQNCCTAGCASCLFPTITCQCSQVKANTLSGRFPSTSGCTPCSFFICNLWRSFWFGNLVDSADSHVRVLEGGREENTREYLGRIGTVRNAFGFDAPKIAPEEKAANLRHMIPLHKLRNYFGEKISFYFGWVELLILSLTFPALLGIVMFLCGVIYYAWFVWYGMKAEDLPDDIIGYILAKACDNYATPAFAALMVLWATTFEEKWVRRQRWYSFFWKVESLEKAELERPPLYSFTFAAKLRKWKFGVPFLYIPSVFFTLFFIGLVFFSVYFINVMNIFSITYCPKPREMLNSTTYTMSVNTTDPSSPALGIVVDKVICSLFSSAQVLANSLSMFVLDALFTRLAYWLTDVEGHLTQSEYTDALTLKLFVFRFFNFYTVLFYIAFGIATNSVQYPPEVTGGKSYDYENYGCGEQPCMALLSRQLLSVIVTQPFLNSIIDMSLPLLKRILLAIKKTPTSKATVTPELSRKRENPLVSDLEDQYKLMELSSLGRREFTAEEFTDKMIVYGALVMFSVALPPAPALALFIMRIDLSLDLGRLMNKFRRPLPIRAQDIGMWGSITNFLTYIGIITNPLIVILTSSWGSRFDLRTKFILFLIFEHIVFAVRMLIAYAVPDDPKDLVKLQQLHKMDKDEAQANLIRERTEIATKLAQ